MVSVITELYGLLVYIWEPNTRVKIALLQCVCNCIQYVYHAYRVHPTGGHRICYEVYAWYMQP